MPFLLRRTPAPDTSRGGLAAFWGWNWGLTLAGAALLGLACLMLAHGPYDEAVFREYLTLPLLVALNLLPAMVLTALLYGLLGRAWLALAITALPVMGLALGNYYKLAFRDDPVVASDLPLLGEAGKMAGEYHPFVTPRIALALGICAAAIVAVGLLARGRAGWRGRVLGSVLALAAAAALTPAYLSDALYSQQAAQNHLNRWSSTQQYLARGLLYPFLHSIPDAIPSPPEGYREAQTGQLLASYTDQDIPEEQKVNLVGIMLEAFTDFSRFAEVEVRPEVYALYHALEAESYTGNLVTNIFAGGTVNTERAFLTGINTASLDYRSNASSYVWYLKSQGYQTSGDHPCNNWFYNRLNVNRYLGFDRYRFSEDFYAALSGQSTANDDIFFPQLTQSILDQMEDDRPLFSFSVSYQGHGPYSDEVCWYGDADDFVGNEQLDQGSRNILANYLASVRSTQASLMELVDTLRTTQEPVVLIVFGDHKPWLGNSNSVYHALGIDLSLSDEQSFYNYWSTRYLIWANDAAKAALGNDFVGEGPDVSPCFLMQVLFEQCGWAGDAYMQATREAYTTLPVMQEQGMYRTAQGTLTDTLTPEEQEVLQRFSHLEYYRSTHFDP